MRTHPSEVDRENAAGDSAEQAFFLSHIIAALARYRRGIAAALLGVAFVEFILALGFYLVAPSTKLARVPFRIEFNGADKGVYPNSSKFSTTDIVALSVLTKVFQQDQLQRYTTFNAFKNAIYVSESNETLDALAREYDAKLNDPRLSPVDRDRLEKEYSLKRESLSHSDYSINMQQSDASVRAIPRDIVEKSLKDIVQTWGEQVYNEKGVLEYRLPVVTTSILDPASLASNDPIARIDILRTKINNILANIDQMLNVPGAEVLRTKGPESISLSEIRINLETTLRVRVEPLFEFAARHGLITNRDDSLAYLRVQQDYVNRRVLEEQGHVQALRDAFAAYENNTAAQRPTTQTAATAPAAAPTVMPQLSEGFLDAIIRMVTESQDVKYRQKQSKEISDTVTNDLLPLQGESTYYQNLLADIQKERPVLSNGAAVEFDARYQTAVQDVRRSVEQTAQIYRLLSQNLNPGNVVYSLSGAIEYRTARALSAPKLVLYSVLLFLLAIPAVLGLALFHNRISEEQELEARLR